MSRGRRSEHTRDELVDLILTEGSAMVAERGYAGFSTRELAKRIGYSLPMILRVMGSTDGLIMSINTRTFEAWSRHLRQALAGDPEDRIRALVHAYFDFAAQNPQLWRSIYEHKPPDLEIPAEQIEIRSRLTGIVVDEVAKAVHDPERDDVHAFTVSLISVVHGHCDLWIKGSWDQMTIRDVRDNALARVRDSLAMRRSPS